MTRYSLCPCDSKAIYPKCCAPYHNGAAPETAMALMRSRYSAYALNLADYIIDTTHPANPLFRQDFSNWKTELQAFSRGTQFINLKIIEFIHGDNTAYVTFRATLSQNGKDASFTEKSAFIKENGNWYYRKAEMLTQE